MTVTMQSALSAVGSSTRLLREAIRELALIATEDQPQGCQAHLVTIVHDAVLDVAAEAEHADATLRQEHGAAAVARCQEHLTLLGTLLIRDLAAPERLSELAALGREYGREAGAWAGEIVRSVHACQLLMWTAVQPALLGYWQELADVADRRCLSGDGR